jgi:glycosyltransferase involved in cell wall biosynthesis
MHNCGSDDLANRMDPEMSLPLVSIVTPSYNQGRFLCRAIDSVLSQDYPHLEYFVLDGGSNDESVDILRSYCILPSPFGRGGGGEGKPFFWLSQPDRGQTDAINQGLRRTRGDILAYLNSDDVLLPGTIAAVVQHFRSNPDWDLLYGNAYHIDEKDRFLGAYPTAPYEFDRLLQSCCICQPAAFWRRRITDRVGLFDESLHYAMDYEYWMRIDRAGGKLVHVPIFLACSRQHAQTKTLSARMQVYHEILEVSRRHADDASFSQYYAYWHHRCHERRDGWPRWLRWIPQCHWWLAVAHRRLRLERQGDKEMSKVAHLV